MLKIKPLFCHMRQQFICFLNPMLNSAIVLWDCPKTYEDNILTFIHELFTNDKNQ